MFYNEDKGAVFVNLYGKRLRDYVLTHFDDPSTYVKKGF